MRGTAVVSWSGGKDSALALHRIRQQGVEVVGLLTMFDPDTGTSRSHGLPPGLLRDQARCLGLPLHAGHADWDGYEAEFKRCLGALMEEGIEAAVFGDIFLDRHREWVERVCAEVGCRPLQPLWGACTDSVAEEILGLEVEARVCTVRLDRVDREWLGRPYDRTFLGTLQDLGIDACGEHGEFHTVALWGPGFRERLRVQSALVREAGDHGHWHVQRWRSTPRAPP